MRTFVVAILELAEGEIRQHVVEAASKRDAYKLVLDLTFGRDYWKDYIPDAYTAEDIEEIVFDSDTYISAVEILA